MGLGAASLGCARSLRSLAHPPLSGRWRLARSFPRFCWKQLCGWLFLCCWKEHSPLIQKSLAVSVPALCSLVLWGERQHVPGQGVWSCAGAGQDRFAACSEPFQKCSLPLTSLFFPGDPNPASHQWLRNGT